MPKTYRPLISVIMPSYNHEAFVSIAIESVLSQTYDNYELIIIDDGSTDATWSNICKYKNHPQIICRTRENRGLIATLKELRDIAKGEYITILASDDFFHNEKLEVMVGLLETRPGAAMCVGRTSIIDESGNFKKRMAEEYDGFGDLYSRLLYGKVYVSSVSLLIKTELYQSIEYTNPYIEDLPAWLQIAKGRDVLYTPIVVAFYRITSRGMSSNVLRMVSSEQEIVKDFLFRQEKVFYSYPKNWCARWFKALAKNHKKSALKFLISKDCSLGIFLCIDFYKAIFKLILPSNQ